MDPLNNQPQQPPQTPGPDQPQSVITPQQPFMQPQPTMPPSGSKKKMLLVAVVVLAILAGGAFFLIKKSNGSPDAAKVAQQSSKSAGAEAKEMSTLQSLSFVAPEDMSAFTPKTVSGGKNIYVTKDSVDGKTCTLSFGIYSASELPGADINEILKPQLDNLKKTGVAIQGPVAGEPLVVKDVNGTSYSMPSLTFDMAKGTQHETDHYSISVLGNGERAVVLRSCADKSGTVDQSAFDLLETTAKKVTIKAE